MADLYVEGVYAHEPRPSPPRRGDLAFQRLLTVQLSGHARERMGRDLSPEQHEALAQAVTALLAKGANQSVVVMQHEAYLVSVKNRTVITHFAAERLRGAVIQGVDSVYFAAATVGPGTGKPGTAEGRKRSEP
jgi:flagellar operon protein